MAWLLNFSNADNSIQATMDESQINQCKPSFDESENGESSSTNIDHEASILKNEGPCNSIDNYVSDCGPDTGQLPATSSQQLQPTVRNRRPLSRLATTYELDKFSKNLMLVFNMYEIPNYKPRFGTDKDFFALKNCFEPRGFVVVEHKDYTKDQIYATFEELILEDLSDFGCVAVVFLTHGKNNGVLLTKDHPIHESSIIEFLTGSNAPSLITKPKILIFQACRGSRASQAVSTGDEIQMSNYSRDGEYEYDQPYRMANETDFLRLHSAYPGMVAHRGRNEGSWFIQSLCKFISASYPDDDILSIIPLVIQDVSINYEHQNSSNNSDLLAIDKQVPILTATLSRKLCFNTKRIAPILIESECSDDTDSTIAPKHVIYNETHGGVIKKIMETRNNIQRSALSNRSLSDSLLNNKYNPEDFRLKYFEYVRDVLDCFVKTSGPDCPCAKQATPILNIAKTIDCSLSLTKTRDQTCLQMMMFLEDQDFEGKEYIFCYKYT